MGFCVALSLGAALLVGPLVVVLAGASTVAVALVRTALRRSLLVCLVCSCAFCTRAAGCQCMSHLVAAAIVTLHGGMPILNTLKLAPDLACRDIKVMW